VTRIGRIIRHPGRREAIRDRVQNMPPLLPSPLREGIEGGGGAAG
jgi:hypothetical protein